MGRYGVEWSTLVDRAYFQNERPEMLSLLPHGCEKLLEIGCGEGRFAASVPDATETWGIEPDQASARIAASRLDRVLAQDFVAAREHLPLGYFDAIICNDVIEHMDDHEAFLSDIMQYVRPQGVLVGSVPNIRYFRTLFDLLVAKDWHYKESGVLDRTHKRFFTLKSLARSLREAGFGIDDIRGVNAALSFRLLHGQARYTLFGWAAIILTFGYWRDIAYMQLAFRARRRD